MSVHIGAKSFAWLCMLFVSTTLSAQKQYFLPTGDSLMDEKDRPQSWAFPFRPANCRLWEGNTASVPIKTWAEKADKIMLFSSSESSLC